MVLCHDVNEYDIITTLWLNISVNKYTKMVHCTVIPTHLCNKMISGVIWCDIDCVWLVKQVLRLFPAFSCFIWHLPSIKWIGVALLTQHVMNTCQNSLRWQGTSYRRTTQKTEHFRYIGEQASCQLHSNIFGIQQLSTKLNVKMFL